MCTCVSGALVKTHVLPAVGRGRTRDCVVCPLPGRRASGPHSRQPGWPGPWQHGLALGAPRPAVVGRGSLPPWPCKSSLGGVCACVPVCLSVCLLPPPPPLLSFSLAPSFGLRPCLGVRLCPWVGLCACAPGSPPGCRACAGLECHLSVGLPVTRLFQALADDGSCHAAGRGAEC